MENIYENNPEVGKKKPWYRRKGCFALLVIAMLVAVVIFIFVFRIINMVQEIRRGDFTTLPNSQQFTTSNIKNNVLTATVDRKRVESADDPYLGPVNAKVVIVEFSDFECPFCREAFPIIRELMAGYSDKVKFIYRNFPVSDAHTDAQKAAEAGQCAAEQGRFWPMHDKIFLNQDNIKVNDLKRYAREVGLNGDIFDQCLDSGKFKNKVLEDFNEGIALGVIGTPTWFIDGVKVEGVIPLDKFKAAIDGQLRLTP